MAVIVETPNAFEPLIGLRKHVHPGGVSIREWLHLTYPGFIEFNQPTVCIVNGQPTLRRDWDKEIKPNDVINFVAAPGWVWVIVLVVLLIVAVVLALTLGQPTTPGEQPGSDPVFSTSGQRNSIRLGEPIEVNYGRNRIYPSLASRPFFRYVDNDQFQHSLFCIGQGTYEIHNIQVGDTDINDYQEVEYELLEPGDQTTLFKTNVYTSVEAGGQTLFAENEPEYVAPGYAGPFPAVPVGETTERLEFDFVFPKGIYNMDNKKGDMHSIEVTLEVEIRLIDDLGDPLGDWVLFLNPTIVGATTTPQRRTIGDVVAAGRYEARVRRSGTKSLSSKVGYDVVWESMRSFLVGDEPDFGNVTLLAVKIRATNNLNSRTQERFNVLATRKLPTRGHDDSSGASFTVPVATRSIVWAFVDIFRNSAYGARVVEDKFFDWDALLDLDDFYEGRGEHFDWTFRDAITVWEAAKVVARVGRAVPLLIGSLITMRRDGPLTVPVTMFTPNNMVKGSFEWSVKLWEPNENDSISVEYTDPDTGYKQEQVLAVLPGGTTDNPMDLRFPGIQDRNHAYREGLYILASQRYLRENISFDTGMEGFIPSFGDLVLIAHDMPRWGQSGYVVAVRDLEGCNRFDLFLSEPVTFTEGQEHAILLRGSKGEVLGPFVAESTEDTKKVTITTTGEEVDFLLTGRTDPMLFMFGIAEQWTKYGRVVKIEPMGGERIKVTCVNEDQTIHSFDDLIAPPLTFPSLPPVTPDLPVIPALYLSQVDDYVQASWLAAFGAQSYIVQTSTDGTNWQYRADTVRTSALFIAEPGLLYVRVAAINLGQGPWIQDSIELGRWILEDGVWDDDGVWKDNKIWNDD